MGHGFKLTQFQVDRQKTPGVHSDGAGLYLNVTKNSSKSWLYRYMISGKAHWMGLGSYPDVSLALAREHAAEYRKLVRQGVDPLAEKHKQRDLLRAAIAKAISFDKAAEQFIEDNKAGWKNPKHVSQWKNTLAAYASPTIGKLDVSLVETAHVITILKPIWTDKTETATRLRGRIENVLDWATVHKYRTGENPARWKGHLEHLLPNPSKVANKKHHAALPWRETEAFMASLRKQEGIGARALEFAILTAARSGEVRLSTWDEIDMNLGVWTIPAMRMKASRDHRVPLSKQAIAVLKQMESLFGTKGLVFPGAKEGSPLSDMTLTAVLRRMKLDDLTAHGFRSSFRDWAAEATHYPSEMAEMALAHTVSNKVEAAYRRGDMFEKRRRMMQDWADFGEQQNNEGEVIPIMSKTAA